MSDLKQLTKAALLSLGLNGLLDSEYDGCACHVDDLMPCDAPKPTCEACVLALVKRGECKDESCELSDDDHYHKVDGLPPTPSTAPAADGEV